MAWSSCPRASHPRALSESCVKVPPHTALPNQPSRTTGPVCKEVTLATRDAPLSMGIENGTLPGGLERGPGHPGSREGSGATGAGAGVLGRCISMTVPRSGLARH